MDENKSTPCPLCKSTNHFHYLTGFDRVFPRKENFKYVKCKQCDLVFINPMPSNEDISSFYGKEYGPHQSGKPGRVDKRLTSPLNKFIIKNYLSPEADKNPSNPLKRNIARLLCKFSLKNILHPKGNNSLLDVGCGSGEWLFQHKSLGWHAEGVEMNHDACQKARNFGLNIYQGSIFDAPEENKYDIITFNHVIEHVPNPVETLQQAKKMLNKDGIIRLLLPNLDSFGFRRFKDFWFPLDPPRHLIQFSINTAKFLAKQAGLDVSEIKTLPKTRFMLKSSFYEKYLGHDFINLPLDERERRIKLCKKKSKISPLRKKIYKRIMFFYTLLWPKKYGEILQITLQKK